MSTRIYIDQKTDPEKTIKIIKDEIDIREWTARFKYIAESKTLLWFCPEKKEIEEKICLPGIYVELNIFTDTLSDENIESTEKFMLKYKCKNCPATGFINKKIPVGPDNNAFHSFRFHYKSVLDPNFNFQIRI